MKNIFKGSLDEVLDSLVKQNEGNSDQVVVLSYIVNILVTNEVVSMDQALIYI